MDVKKHAQNWKKSTCFLDGVVVSGRRVIFSQTNQPRLQRASSVTRVRAVGLYDNGMLAPLDILSIYLLRFS